MDNDDIKDEIKRRVDIVSLVSRYVTLQRAGRRMRARCPFHEETQASFYVDPASGFYHCFGCGAGGDVFSFLMQIEGLTFPEAAERLADMAGLRWRSSPGAKQASQQRDTVRSVNEYADEFFQQTLRSDAGAAARKYLAERGINEASVQGFNLGYAPDSWDSLLRYLAGKGISGQVAEQAGLVKPRATGGYYDTFRNRVMFPIYEVNGRVIGFGGRTLDPDEDAKYINSPETALFKKGRTVYGLNLARQAISDANQVLVVEGYTDVISVVQAGIGNVVACLGTATTADHLRLLSRYADEVVFIYDADAAGMEAALRNIETFENAAADVKVAVLPTGQDPDEVARDLGAEGFMNIVEKRLSLVEYQLRMIFLAHQEQTGSDRAAAAREAAQMLTKVPDAVRRDEFLATAADWWGQGNTARTEAMQRVLTEELRKVMPQSRYGRGRYGKARYAGQSDRQFITDAVSRSAGDHPAGCLKMEAAMLSAALTDSDFAGYMAERLAVEDLVDERDRVIYTRLVEHLQSGQGYVPQTVIDKLPEAGAVRDRGVELWMQEVDCGLERKVLDSNIEKLQRYRAWRAWREQSARIAEAIDGGELSPDSPEYLEFKRRSGELGGPGSTGYHTYEADWGVAGSNHDTAPRADAGIEEAKDDEGS